MLTLRNPQLSASQADVVKGAELKVSRAGSGNIIPIANGHIGFRNIDLTGIRQLQVAATAPAREGHPGGTIEIRLDSPTGELLGQIAVPVTGQKPNVPSAAQAMQDAGGALKPATPAPAAKPANAGLKADIKDIKGTHHVYLVFRNGQAKALQPLMSLSSIRFNPESN